MTLKSHQSQDTTESRFIHLLNPIKDLTKNWEVDIAKVINLSTEHG